ncbi:hypothetical protein [Corynebacterium auris]|uniref:hypothetical protein n=1 Tax=Corynebacterium auris TaxID=44750 RepID=UPI0025B4E8FD|nr:hypothetical protein [Corynebacterium auris]WJY67707.1 hypothetical protein CAURIS_03955 [Corynebacterium auris]
MNLSSSRTAVAAGFAAVAALGLAACSPPGEVDSEQKVDTATDQDPNSLSGGTAQSHDASPTNVAEVATSTAPAADSLPVLRNCGEAGEIEPNQVDLACAEQNDFIEDIEWNEWSADLATGVGTRVTREPDRRVEDIEIVLGNPELIDGELQFTTVTVDGISINPESQYN